MRSQNLFTIGAHAPFLHTLAKKILDGTILRDWDLSNAFALSDITIFLPTQRARQELRNIFKEIMGGASLLPNIVTFGDEENELIPFLPPFDAPDLASAISPLRRNLILASLVEKWLIQKNKAIKPSAHEVLNMADSLAKLIDAINIEQIDIKSIKNIAPENLTAYWQETLEFLDIALEIWPKILLEENRIDASDLQNKILSRQTNALKHIYGEKPVIAAGSTGSILATANLIKSIKQLKNGAIVLAGLDISLNEQEFKALLDKKNNPHSHPQYGLAQLLFRLKSLPNSFDELAPKTNNARSKIVRHALALADNTTNWIDAKTLLGNKIASAFKGVAIAQANNDEQQARAIAIATNDAVNLGKSVGIISPDRNLARRIIAELKRFNIEIDDSAGTPLFQTSAGRLVRQIIALCVSDFAPLNLIALLRNYFSNFSLNRREIAKLTNLLEYAILRGSYFALGLEGIKQQVEENLVGNKKYAPYKLNVTQANKVNHLLDKIENALSPLSSLLAKENFTVSQFAQELGNALRATINSNDSQQNYSPDINRIFTWLDDLQTSGNLGPVLNKHNIEAALAGLMNNISVIAKKASRSDVAIWGLLEARLQTRDLLILAGLNETIWPQIADPGPWLSRNMAISAGLEPPERRQGQAAHDFMMALGNEKVLITYAKNIGTSPALVSRLLRRLSAFIGEEQVRICERRGEEWLQKAKAIDFVKEVKPALRPTPCPPKNKRPKSLSVTEIETLIRSPYDIYAKHILKLKPLDNLAQQPSGRERGNIIHEILDRFIKANINPFDKTAMEQLLAIAQQEFALLSALPAKQALWFERFKEIGEQFIKFEQSQAANIKQRNSEIDGKWVFKVGDELFTLKGKADRIDLLKNGFYQIVDYKTGAVPKAKISKDFLAPQLLLEALMLENGAFEQIGSGKVGALKYIKISNAPNAFEVSDFPLAKDYNLERAIDEVSLRLMRHIDALLFSDKLALSAHVLPNPEQRFMGNYDHLARVLEWSIIDFDGEKSNE